MSDQTGQLKNLDPQTGATPRVRVGDARSALRICQNVIDCNRKRGERNALVQGLIDGNPPYSRGKLRSTGQAYRANFNDNQALSLLEGALTAYYDLFSEVSHWATVKVDTGNPQIDVDLGRKITTAFNDLQKKDTSMEDAINVSQHEMVSYGAGPLIFDREDDWTASPVKYDDFMVSNNEPSEMAKWTKVVVREYKTVAQMMAYIEDEEVATTLGFHPEEIRKSVMMASDQKLSSTSDNDWQKLQEAIRANDLEYTGPDKEVHVGRLLYREFPSDKYPEGGISEVWVDLNNTATGFLFKHVNKWKDWSDFMQAFMLNRGTGKYHSIKGLAVRMYSALQTKLRLDNAAVDAGFFMASIHARKKSGGPSGAEGALYLGPLTLWKSDYDPMNFQNAAAGVEAATAIAGNMDLKLQSNLSQFQPSPGPNKGNPRTATEVAVTANKESVLTKTSIAKYFKQLDGWYFERFKRATFGDLNTVTDTAKAAKEYRKALEEMGIPKEILKKCTVTATRTVGQGSQFLRQQTLQNLWVTIGGSVPEGGRDALLDDLIAAQAGFEAVARYNPNNKMAVTEQDQAWEARVENAMVMVGEEPMLTDTQDDFIHALTHLDELQQGLSALGQGTDPTKIAMFGVEIIPHIEAHIARITDDPLRREKVKELVRVFNVAKNQLQQVVQALQKEQESGNQEQQESEQVNGKIGLDAMKLQAELEMKRESHEQAMKFAQERHDQQLAINDAHAADQIRQTKS